jgi:tetratricopeptide (TPR) repeat protein
MAGLLGAGLVWWWWYGHRPSEAPTAVVTPPAQPTEPRTASGPSAVDPGLSIPEPQAEAAALKQEAVRVASQVAEAYPNDALSYALLGSAYYNTGQSEEATRHLRRCLELNPGLADAYDILARIAYEKGELEESVRLCQEALKRGPANAEVLNQLGRALMDLGRTAEASQTLEQAARLPRPTSESYYLLGQAGLQSGNPAQAKENFKRAIALLPDHTQAFFGLYTACMRLGQTEEADRYRGQFLKLEAIDRRTLTDRSAQEDTLTGLPLVRKTVARTFFGAAQIHGLHEQAGEAAGLFQRAAGLDAENPAYRGALEAFYVQRKALAEGVSAFEQLAAEQPGNSLNHFFLGRLHERLNQFDAAERAYRHVQQFAPDWSEGYRALADLYLRANLRPAEARAMARRALELEPSGDHYYLLAVACLRSNDRTAALEAIEQAIVLSPNEARYRTFLEQLKGTP